MAWTIFLLAAAAGVLLAGAGIFWALYQLAQTLQHTRQVLLPQVEITLTEVQRNLNQLDTLTKDVDTTVEEATQLVASANRTVQSVGDGLETFNRKVAMPLMIGMSSAIEGARAGVKHLRERRARRVMVISDGDIEATQPVNEPVIVEQTTTTSLRTP